MSKRGVEETLPFDEDTLVYKVMGKMFALTSFSEPDRCNLKCNPDYALDLRADYTAVTPGYHMNKTHWNTVSVVEDVPEDLILELIDHSYSIIYNSLPKKVRNELEMG